MARLQCDGGVMPLSRCPPLSCGKSAVGWQASRLLTSVLPL